MPDHDYVCGDLLRCASPYYSEQLRITGDYGIVMGTKPHHIHVWFESQRRGYWITYDLLRHAEVDPTPLLSRIRTITKMLNAEEWELEESKETSRLLCYVDDVPFETLVNLRSYLDREYVKVVLGPEGMGRMIATIEWSNR